MALSICERNWMKVVLSLVGVQYFCQVVAKLKRNIFWGMEK